MQLPLLEIFNLATCHSNTIKPQSYTGQRECVFFSLFTDYIFVQAFQAFHFPPFREAIKHCIWGKTNKQTHSHKCTVHMQRGEHKKKEKEEEEDRRGETHTLPLQQNTAIMEAAAVRRKGGVYATLSSQEIIYVHTHKHTHMHSRSKHPDRCWGFFFVKWDTSSIVAAIKATTPRAGTQKEF